MGGVGSKLRESLFKRTRVQPSFGGRAAKEEARPPAPGTRRRGLLVSGVRSSTNWIADATISRQIYGDESIGQVVRHDRTPDPRIESHGAKNRIREIPI